MSDNAMMVSIPNRRAVQRIEPKADFTDALINKGTLGAADSLRLHWPEYLMEAGEAAIYLFSACAVATFLWHPASPVQRYLPSDVVRRMLMGLAWRDYYDDRPFAVGQTVRSALQSRGHIHFLSIRKSDPVGCPVLLHCTIVRRVSRRGARLSALRGAPAHHAVRYAATLPGIYGDGIAFVAELVISFLLMSAILFSSNHRVLAPYTHYFAAILTAVYIAFESPLSGMSANPARTFGPAVYASYWHALWIYFVAPPLGMLAAGEVFLWVCESTGPHCAKLHHDNDKRCIFCQSGPRLAAANKKQAHYA